MVKKKSEKEGVNIKKLWIALPIIIVVVVAVLFWYSYSNQEEEIKLEDIEVTVTEDQIARCLDRLNNKGDIHSFVGAITKKDISVCSADESCLDDYYFFSTILDNSNYCGNIKDDTLKSSCNMLYSSDSRCPALDKDQKIICEVFLGAASTRCNKIKDTFIRSECLSFPALLHALKEKNVDKCYPIENADRKSICLRLLGNEFTEDEKREICIEDATEMLRRNFLEEQKAQSNS